MLFLLSVCLSVCLHYDLKKLSCLVYHIFMFFLKILSNAPFFLSNNERMWTNHPCHPCCSSFIIEIGLYKHHPENFPHFFISIMQTFQQTISYFDRPCLGERRKDYPHRNVGDTKDDKNEGERNRYDDTLKDWSIPVYAITYSIRSYTAFLFVCY